LINEKKLEYLLSDQPGLYVIDID